jgi:hypothetical protein
MDIKVFVDTDDDTRFIRRLNAHERARLPCSGHRAAFATVSRCTWSSWSRASGADIIISGRPQRRGDHDCDAHQGLALR